MAPTQCWGTGAPSRKAAGASSGPGTHVSAIKGVWSAGQHRAHAVWIFEFDKAKASRLVGRLVFHDHAVHDLSILGKVAAQRLCSEVRTHTARRQAGHRLLAWQPDLESVQPVTFTLVDLLTWGRWIGKGGRTGAKEGNMHHVSPGRRMSCQRRDTCRPKAKHSDHHKHLTLLAPPSASAFKAGLHPP